MRCRTHPPHETDSPPHEADSASWGGVHLMSGFPVVLILMFDHKSRTEVNDNFLSKSKCECCNLGASAVSHRAEAWRNKAHSRTHYCAVHAPAAPEASILGGGGGGSRPNENIGVANISFCPPPKLFWQLVKFIICDAKIGLKLKSTVTVRHYKTIQFNMKIQLNIYNFQFCGALQAQSLILRFCALSAPKIRNFPYFCPPPPPPNPRNGSTPLPAALYSVSHRPGAKLH